MVVLPSKTIIEEYKANNVPEVHTGYVLFWYVAIRIFRAGNRELEVAADQ